jgi:hypothetical protein
MTQKQMEFDKNTRDDQSHNNWASQSKKTLSAHAPPAQSLLQKLSPEQLKQLKDHHHDVVDQFVNTAGSRPQPSAPIPSPPASNHWPVVAAKPFEAVPSATLWSASTSQVCAAPSALGKECILSSFGQRKPSTAATPSLQSFLNGEGNCSLSQLSTGTSHVFAGSAPGLPAVRRGFDTLVRSNNSLGGTAPDFAQTSNQSMSLQRFGLASAPSSDSSSSNFGMGPNRACASRGSIVNAPLNPRYMTSYNHMSMLSAGRTGLPQMR